MIGGGYSDSFHSAHEKDASFTHPILRRDGCHKCFCCHYAAFISDVDQRASKDPSIFSYQLTSWVSHVENTNWVFHVENTKWVFHVMLKTPNEFCMLKTPNGCCMLKGPKASPDRVLAPNRLCVLPQHAGKRESYAHLISDSAKLQAACVPKALCAKWCGVTEMVLRDRSHLISRDVVQAPNDYTFWVEQGMDPAHANFLHHGSES